MTKTIAIIPARGGSKRLPNKNTLLLGGIPLLAHSILYAQANLAIIDEVYVTTNNEEIKNFALQFGAKVIDRPDAISSDLEPTITALQHVISTLEYEVENCVVLQPTNPLRPKKLLHDCFQKYQELKIESLFTVTRNHQKFGTISNDKFIPFNYKIGQRSQDLVPLFFENGLLYITNSKSIKKGEIISKNAFPFITNHIFAQVDIDTQEDFDYAEYLYNNS
jgi:N-acylneuraminate cytidylyltransferase